MTSAEAREILVAWRPGWVGAVDEEVTQALALARRDPELGAWWSAQQAFHDAARDALRAPAPPADLADRILTARKVRPAAFAGRRSAPAWIAVAAVLTLVAGLWFAFRPAPATDESGFDVFRSRMVRAVLREYRMDVTTNDLTTIRGFLARHAAPADFELQPPLAAAPPLGAGLLTWQGRPVSMVCLDGGHLGTLFLFVAPAETLRRGAPDGPRFEQVNRLATVSWSRGSRTYVLAAVATPEQLREWFESAPRERAAAAAPRGRPFLTACGNW